MSKKLNLKLGHRQKKKPFLMGSSIKSSKAAGTREGSDGD
jgi:hypothetical protein